MGRFLLRKIFAIAAVFIYLLFPLDLMPDLLGPLGRIDDLIMLGLLGWYLWSGKTPLGSWGERLGWGRPRRPIGGERATGSGAEREEGETDPYRILEVDPQASTDEVRRAYRRQVARYHPDRVSHLGPEFQRLAHRKFIRIQKAYEEISRLRGESP